MRCKKCKKEASEGRPLLVSPIIRITRGERSKPLGLNDLNRAKGIIRLFDCFLSRINALPMENEVSMKIRTLLVHKDLVEYKYNKMKQSIHLWGKKYPQPILGNSYVVSRGTRMQIG